MVKGRFETSQALAFVLALPQAAVVVDQNSRVVAANHLAAELFEADPTGQHLTFALRAPAVLDAVSGALNEAKTSRVQYTLRAPVPRTLDVHVAPLGALESGSTIALLMLHDLTYHEQIERMRADFVANASHELRTPLTALAGFIETMQGAAKNDPAARDMFLAMMKAQAGRMASLIDDLLSLSRVEISEHVPPSGIVDLVPLARQAAELLKPVAGQAGCELKLDLPPALQVRGDEAQLSQVIHNLLENAIKYAADGKSIEVVGRSRAGEAELAVIDHGPGIAAHHVPRLTERFYRVDVQDSRTRGGTGLGLAIAKHIVNRHRGRLAIDSEPGRGSTFTLFLPSAK